MKPFNATVTTGFQNRDGDFVHWLQPDKGAPVQATYFEALPEGKRVRLIAGRIEDTQ